jgi:hypothetical protein
MQIQVQHVLWDKRVLGQRGDKQFIHQRAALHAYWRLGGGGGMSGTNNRPKNAPYKVSPALCSKNLPSREGHLTLEKLHHGVFPRFFATQPDILPFKK